MDPLVSADDLARAAEAAGYALAFADDQFDEPARTVPMARQASIEQRARGAREPKPATVAPIAAAPRRPDIGLDIKGRLAHGASAVRHSVSGYLRLGTPA